MVEVSVDSTGIVTDLRLDERVRGLPAWEIGQRILAVMRSAQAQLAEKVAQVSAEAVGAGT